MACSLTLPLKIGHALPKPRSLDDAELKSLARGDEISAPNDMPFNIKAIRSIAACAKIVNKPVKTLTFTRVVLVLLQPYRSPRARPQALAASFDHLVGAR